MMDLSTSHRSVASKNSGFEKQWLRKTVASKNKNGEAFASPFFEPIAPKENSYGG
jgi:hypothetical protein